MSYKPSRHSGCLREDPPQYLFDASVIFHRKNLYSVNVANYNDYFSNVRSSIRFWGKSNLDTTPDPLTMWLDLIC